MFVCLVEEWGDVESYENKEIYINIRVAFVMYKTNAREVSIINETQHIKVKLKSVKFYPDGRKIHLIPLISKIQTQME